MLSALVNILKNHVANILLLTMSLYVVDPPERTLYQIVAGCPDASRGRPLTDRITSKCNRHLDLYPTSAGRLLIFSLRP